jgi:hypothetical protein
MLKAREQRVLALEKQVSDLQAAAEQLDGAVSNAEITAHKTYQLEQQVGRLAVVGLSGEMLCRGLGGR